MIFITLNNILNYNTIHKVSDKNKELEWGESDIGNGGQKLRVTIGC